MNFADANVLLYTVNIDAAHHQHSRRWLDNSPSGEDMVFASINLLAFPRLATKAGLFPAPLPVPQATERVEAWLGAAPSVVVEPTFHHARLVQSLLAPLGSRRDPVNDAQLGALAIEHRCGTVSFDADFRRFPGVRWVTAA